MHFATFPTFTPNQKSAWLVIITFGLLLCFGLPLRAQAALVQVCPAVGIQPRTADFQPGGIILTAFDRTSMWVYNIDRQSRYPLPETFPCGTNCRLSGDARWITYVNASNNSYGKMRVDGTERTLLVEYAADVEWWDTGILLVWTPGHSAYLQAEGSLDREYLNVESIISVQPRGRWGVLSSLEEDYFVRDLINLETRDLPGISSPHIRLGLDVPYFNAAAWSADGRLAYVAPGAFDSQVGIAGGEIFGVRPSDPAPVQWTDLTSTYGAVRINGSAAGELSWSPDSTRIAFWVIELLGANPEANTGNAVLHVLDVNSGDVMVYCGYSTSEHTPNPPRLVWSPDSTHVAFAGDVAADNKGYLLLALDLESGIFTELSDGIYPALGGANAVAWGVPPS